MAAFVRVSGHPNQDFLCGFPGVSATLAKRTQPRLEGKVEIRPSVGISAPVLVHLVTICLQRRESIHPTADSVMSRRLTSPRKEIIDTIGKEMLLFRCHPSRENESVLSMDLPFVIFIPFGKGNDVAARRVPPASLQLPSRTAETVYELVVTIQQGHSEQKRYAFPVPISRYDTLSTFGMYNQAESAERVSDHLVTMAISLPRWSYGPLDPVGVYIRLTPNPDWLSKARKVTIQKITIGIDEEIIYNHEGDEPSRKVKTLAKQSQPVGVKLPDAGYMTNLGLVFPAKDLRDSEGINPRGKKGFPSYSVASFTTTGTLYKIEYYLTVKATLSGAKDISMRQPIVVCPYDHAACKEEMEAIGDAARAAAEIRPHEPMLPAPAIVRASEPGGLRALGVAMVGGLRKPLIE